MEGGFATERDYQIIADAALDEIQHMTEPLEDAIDDFEVNYSVRHCILILISESCALVLPCLKSHFPTSLSICVCI